jgi:hypothetical protein
MPAEATGVALEQLPALAPLLGEQRWCCWRWEWKAWRRGEAHKGAWTKVPWFPAKRGPGQPLQTSHPEQARAYAIARDMVLRGNADGVGWVVTGETEWVWLDLDKCRDPKTGVVAPWAAALLERVRAIGLYTEISPSGQGVRVLGRAGLDAPMQGRVDMTRLLAGLGEDGLQAWGGSRECHKLAGIEMFFACVRYVTLTGWDAAGGPGGDAGGLAMELWQLAEGQKGAARKGRASKALPGEDKRAPVEDVVSALSVITNDDGWDVPASWEEWNRIGMAVFAATGGEPEGLEAWMAWSTRSELKHVPAACEERWAHWTSSSPPTEIGFGALAIAAGEATRGRWRRPSRAPSVEFDVETEPDEGAEGELTRERELPPFFALLDRVAFVKGMGGRYFDKQTLGVMKEPDLLDLAGQLRVPGHSEQGKKGIVARLRGARDPAMVRLVGLGCMPGQGPVGESAIGKPGLRGNLWAPPLLVPSEGDAGRWLEHGAAMMGVDDLRRVLDWLAFVLQRPGVKINHALVLLGETHGGGKDTFLKPFIAAIGQHNVAVIAGSQLGGAFNSELTRQVLQINEMPSAHKRDFYEDMKPLLAAPPDMLRINEKMLPPFWIPNIINVVITTNHIGAIALADSDRRFDIVSTHPAIDGTEAERAAYYRPLHAWMDAGGSAAAAGWLLRRDVTAFDPAQAPPDSDAKTAMTREGAHPIVGWVLDLVAAGGELAGRNLVTIAEIVDLARRGVDGASTTGWVLPEHVARALTLSGWRQVVRARFEGARHRVWARRTSVALLEQLPAKPWVSLLEEDRKRVSGSEF